MLGVMSHKKVSHKQGLLMETCIVLVGRTLDLRSDYLNSVENCTGIGRGLFGGNLQRLSCSQVVESLVELARVRFNQG